VRAKIVLDAVNVEYFEHLVRQIMLACGETGFHAALTLQQHRFQKTFC